MREKGFVYLIEDTAKHVKIGTSKTPKDRIDNVMGQSLSKMVNHFISEEVLQPYRLEKSMHLNFDKHRVHGEWFNISFKDAKRTLISEIKTADYVSKEAIVDQNDKNRCLKIIGARGKGISNILKRTIRDSSKFKIMYLDVISGKIKVKGSLFEFQMKIIRKYDRFVSRAESASNIEKFFPWGVKKLLSAIRSELEVMSITTFAIEAYLILKRSQASNKKSLLLYERQAMIFERHLKMVRR